MQGEMAPTYGGEGKISDQVYAPLFSEFHSIKTFP